MKPLSDPVLQLLAQANNAKEMPWGELYKPLNANGLTPWVFQAYGHEMPQEIQDQYKKDYVLNALLTEQLLSETKEIEALFPGDLVRIKGSALHTLIYDQNPVRVFTDVDFLSTIETQAKVIYALEKRGFQKHQILEWEATKNRVCYFKSISPQITISFDLHTSLFWRAEKEIKWQIEKEPVQGFFHLAPEDHFFYLTVNWAYQDTFIGLNKFLDLILFWKKYSCLQTWQTGRLIELIKVHGLDHTFQMVFQLLDQWGNCDTIEIRKSLKPSLSWALKMITPDFLLEPKQHPFKYIFLKHYAKKSFHQAFSYDLGWVGVRARNIYQ